MNSRGQAMIEFTLVTMLMLIIMWIPADFGLAFYTAQLAQNASREGARIAAADPNANNLAGTACALAACLALPAEHPQHRAARRVAAALMPDATINFQIVGAGCNQQVVVTVRGTYNYFFYHLLGWFGIETAPVSIVRQASTRWEHQC